RHPPGGRAGPLPRRGLGRHSGLRRVCWIAPQHLHGKESLMADDDPKLSYDELVAILKQSTALEARRGAMTVSKQDLLDAARQLGIDEKAATEVVEAHLKRRASTEGAPRPFNTRIALEVTPDLLSLTVPPLPPSGRTLGPLGFACFWLAFVGF